MDRIYMNRIEGQRRIHVEILDNEVSDLLDDLKTDPERFAATHAFLDLLRIAEETLNPVVAEGRRNREDAARTASGQQPEHTCPDGQPCPSHDELAAAVGQCGKWGGCVLDADHTGPHRHTPRPAVGQPAEAQATDEAEILARAASDLCAFGHGEAAAFLLRQTEAVVKDEARPPENRWHVVRKDGNDWIGWASAYSDPEYAADALAQRRECRPDDEFRLVRETTTWTVEDETR
ncbi:hypothetical protein ACFY8P_04490 [Streptomyces sp. NPDC012693]|uniref:hypothetical protein n=1 Tax=Streptomyces sp. NPDC012693 TaxID=3364844 RepID=UPI0036A19855